MKWQPFEDRICCVIFIKNHVLSEFSVDTSVKEAIKKGFNKAEGSIKMKFSNIASLCDDYGVKVLTKMGRLANYSVQNKAEFEGVLNTLSLLSKK